jgi:predicted RNA-binding Zn ribbon-like protein
VSTREPAGPHFFPVANLACLDLVNTEPMVGGERVDLLKTFPDLVTWLRAAGILAPAEARAALRRWTGTVQAASTLADVKALRSALRSMAERMASGKAAGDDAIAAINRVLARRPAYLQVVRDGSAFVTRVQPLASSARHLIVPVAESAAWLLEHGDPSLVRQCEGDECVLVFYDTTKNKRRRWCSMDLCGSRSKSAAYYRRTRREVVPA